MCSSDLTMGEGEDAISDRVDGIGDRSDPMAEGEDAIDDQDDAIADRFDPILIRAVDS